MRDCRINKLKAVPLLLISKDYRSIRESNHYIQGCAPISGGESRGFVPHTSVVSAAPPQRHPFNAADSTTGPTAELYIAAEPTSSHVPLLEQRRFDNDTIRSMATYLLP